MNNRLIMKQLHALFSNLEFFIKDIKETQKGISYKNNRTTYYVCKGHTCKPPVNDLNEFL